MHPLCLIKQVVSFHSKDYVDVGQSIWHTFMLLVAKYLASICSMSLTPFYPKGRRREALLQALPEGAAFKPIYMTLEHLHDCPFSHATIGLCPVPLLLPLVLGNTTQAEQPTKLLRYIPTMPGYPTHKNCAIWLDSSCPLSASLPPYHLDLPDVSSLFSTSLSILPMVHNASQDCQGGYTVMAHPTQHIWVSCTPFLPLAP